MNRTEYRQLQLAGSVTFPATFPQVGQISLVEERLPSEQAQDCDEYVPFVRVTENPSARVSLSRRVAVDRVRAVFLPRDPNRVSFEDGSWLLGKEILPSLRACARPVLGIVYVGEAEPTLLEVNAGMTAAESAQYYPPLPVDRSHNHYACQPRQSNLGPGIPKSAAANNEDWCKPALSCDSHDVSQFAMSIEVESYELSIEYRTDRLISCDVEVDALEVVPFPLDPTIDDA